MHVLSLQGSKPSIKARAKEPGRAVSSRSRSPATALHPIVQAKLRIGASDDKYEREADRIANEVVRMPERKPVLESISRYGLDSVQGECAACGDGGKLRPACEAKLQRASNKDEEQIQMAVIPGQAPTLTPRIEAEVCSLPSRGEPLTAPERSFFEPRFGADFSAVRVHTGARAMAAASALNARAFTAGRNVVFGAREYAPDQEAGRRLLAHELTHVIQQNCASSGSHRVNKSRSDPCHAPCVAASLTRVQLADDTYGLVQKAQNDDQITGKYDWKKLLLERGDESRRARVFFDLAEVDLDNEQKEQILKPIVDDHANEALVLQGFASEEGSEESNKELVSLRLREVDRALIELGHKAYRVPEPKLEESAGQIDYRFWRAVEIVVGGPEPESRNKIQDCPVMDPAFETKFPEVMQNAVDEVQSAQKILSGADEKVKSHFKGVFFSTDSADIGTVRKNLSRLEEQLELFADTQSSRVQCGTGNDPICTRGAYAYVTGRGLGEQSKLTLCPADPYRLGTLIHESAHAAKDFATFDHAYRHESLITRLTTDQALTNTDSYVVLIEMLNAEDPTFGETNPVRTLPGITTEERETLKETLAWVQSGINTVYSQSAALYSVVDDSIVAGAWTNPEYQKLMASFGPLFGLTMPPSLPRESDKWQLAAIYDRFQKMSRISSAQITGSKTTEDPENPHNFPSWQEGPGFSFYVEPGFFAKDLPERLRDLLTLLVKATPDISSELVPGYVEAIALSRKFLGVTWPWVPA